MNSESFYENFELLAESPNGIKKLREMILQMAVQGKLVPQDENDEPTEVLLGKTGNKKLKPFIQSEESKSKLPIGWRYCFLHEISEIIMGNSPPGKSYNETGEGILLINGPVEFSKGPFGKTIKNKYTTLPTKFCDEGDLLICVRGSTTGRTNIASFKACIGRGVASIRAKFYQNYINYFILAKRQEIYDSGKGSTFPSITTKQINEMIIPLPPLEEQKRIVAKVDQLMALCDQLELFQQKKNESRIQLNNSALNKMLDAGSPEEFAEHWQLVCENFDLLYDDLDNVKKLKQAILQLAVQGKLVEQAANDEPAEVLLKMIREEKEMLVKEGKIKKSKALPQIEADEIPY